MPGLSYDLNGPCEDPHRLERIRVETFARARKRQRAAEQKAAASTPPAERPAD